MNIFIACDGIYYNDWGLNCLRSIKFHVPWINLTAHIVNPLEKNELEGVKYFYEEKQFDNDTSKIAYYQAVRFLKCFEYFPNNELVMTIDVDTVLMRPFSESEFIDLCNKISVQRHQKDIRWMAGLVTYGCEQDFRKQFKKELESIPLEDWTYGLDQDILEKLSNTYSYHKLAVGDWMSFGRGRGTFLTLKGDQKTSPGYLNNYKESLKQVTN
jgi:lipopolysaccharide biosynthesis glycosyltransferase